MKKTLILLLLVFSCFFACKKSEKQLRQSEEKFRTLFNIAPILLNSFDKEGKIILWNKECEKVFGWTKEELNEHDDLISLFYPDKNIRKEVIQTLNENPKLTFVEWTPLTKSGDLLYVMWANVKLPNGETINVGYDITKQKKSEQQLQETKEQLDRFNKKLQTLVDEELEKSRQKDIILQQQSKMASMGEMIENIAHQWRQPLSQINSAVLIVDTRMHINLMEDTKIEEKLQEIESLTDYMSKTIDAFQNFFNSNKHLAVAFKSLNAS